MGRPRSRFSAEDFLPFYEKWKKGEVTMQQVADAMNCSVATVKRYFDMIDEWGLLDDPAERDMPWLEDERREEKEVSVDELEPPPKLLAVARKETLKSLASLTADEAVRRTAYRYTVGKVALDSLMKYLQRKGVPVEELAKTPPQALGKYISDALKKAELADALLEENKELKAAIRDLSRYVDPIHRLETAIELSGRVAEFFLLAYFLFGVDMRETEVGRYYMKLIDDYLMGVGYE